MSDDATALANFETLLHAVKWFQCNMNKAHEVRWSSWCQIAQVASEIANTVASKREVDAIKKEQLTPFSPGNPSKRVVPSIADVEAEAKQPHLWHRASRDIMAYVGDTHDPSAPREHICCSCEKDVVEQDHMRLKKCRIYVCDKCVDDKYDQDFDEVAKEARAFAESHPKALQL